MTQERAAAESGIDYKRYQRLEQGSVNATLRTLVRVATALRTDFWSLVSDGQEESVARPFVEHGLAAVVHERGRRDPVAERDGAAEHRTSISRLLPAGVPRVVEAMTKKGERARWLRHADPALAAVLDAALAEKGALAFDEAGRARLRFTWGGGDVEISITARADGRSMVLVRDRSPSSDAREDGRRSSWVRALEALRAQLSI